MDATDLQEFTGSASLQPFRRRFDATAAMQDCRATPYQVLPLQIHSDRFRHIHMDLEKSEEEAAQAFGCTLMFRVH
jgi:hypothetical protein